MSKVIIKESHLVQLAALDTSIRNLNNQKIKLLFEALDIRLNDKDFEALLEWELILVTVPDRQMAVQLNKLSSYIPNLMFVVDASETLFKVMQGKKGRRVRKER